MQVSKVLTNKYYIYLRRDQEPIPWNPSADPPPDALINSAYLSKVIEAMEKKLTLGGLVILHHLGRNQ